MSDIWARLPVPVRDGPFTYAVDIYETLAPSLGVDLHCVFSGYPQDILTEHRTARDTLWKRTRRGGLWEAAKHPLGSPNLVPMGGWPQKDSSALALGIPIVLVA